MSNKKLYIIRHAKAEEPSWGKSDFDRVLIEKGKQRARQIAEKLKEEIIEINDPVVTLSSTAPRAAETAEIFCNTISYPLKNIQWHPDIYEANYLTILKLLNKIDNKQNTVVVFGHNPGLSDLIQYISGQYINLKTSHVACIELEDGINFASLSENTALLTNVIVNTEN